MKCPKCNRSIEPDSLFCEHCGSKIEQRPAAGAGRTPRPENRFEPKWIIFALLPLLVIGAVALFWFAGTRHPSAEMPAGELTGEFVGEPAGEPVGEPVGSDLPEVLPAAAAEESAVQPQAAAGRAEKTPQATPVKSVAATPRAIPSKSAETPEEYVPANPQPTVTQPAPPSPPNPVFERERQSAGAIYCNGINPDYHDTEQYFSSNIGSMNRDHFVLNFAFLTGEALSQPVMTLSDSHRVLALRLQADGTMEITTDNGTHVYPLRHRYAVNTWYPIELSYCRGSLRVGIGSDYEMLDIVMNSAQLGDNRLSTVDRGTGKAFRGLVRNIGVIRDND